MGQRWWLYALIGSVLVVGLVWFIAGAGLRGFQVMQPPDGLPPGTRFLHVRWKDPLKEPLERGSIPFRLSPEIPILRVSWLGPTEAVIDLSKGLEAGQKYMLIGEGGPFAGAKARFFTQPLAIVQAEGGYLWEEKPDAYHHAIYLRANAELSERDFKGQWGQADLVRFVELGSREYLAVSARPAKEPFDGELVVAYSGQTLYQGEIKAGAYGRYELRQAEVDVQGGRYFIRLRGNRPIKAHAGEVARYVSVGKGVEVVELEVRGIETRLYLGQLPEQSFAVYLRAGYPDGQQGLAQAETLQLAPPSLGALAWSQRDVHYVARGQGLHFVTGPKIKNLSVTLWRIHPDNERLFLEKEVGDYRWLSLSDLKYYGSPILEGNYPVTYFPTVQNRGGLVLRALGKELEPGTYYVRLSPEGLPWSAIDTWFVVSDWYLLSRVWDRQVWVAAIDKEKGRPLSGVKVRLVSPAGQVLDEGTTGREGAALLERPPLTKAHAVIAQRGGQMLSLPLGRFRPPEWPYPTDGFDPGRTPYHLYITGARTLYRPGDTISLHLYVRTHDWKYPTRYPRFSIALRNPNFVDIYKATPELDENGHFHFVYALPQAAPTGTYNLTVSVDASTSRYGGDEDDGEREPYTWSYPLQVEFFRADRLVIDAEVLATASQPVLSLMGRYLYGAVASFQKGEVSARLRSGIPETPLAQGYSWEVRLPDKLQDEFLRPTAFQTDANGQAKVPLPALPAMGLAEIDAKILLYDEENRPNYLGRLFRQPTQPILVGVRREAQWVNAGTPVTLTLRALGGPNYTELAKGTYPIDVEVWEVTYQYQLYESYYEQYRPEYRESRRRVLRTKVEVRDGAGELTFTPQQGAKYEVLLWAPRQQHPTHYEIEAWGWGTSALKGAMEERILIEPQDSAPKAGSKVSLLLKAPLPGKALLMIERERVWHHEWVDLSTGTATVNVKLPREYVPGVYVHVVAFHAIGEKAVPFPTSRGMIYLPVAWPDGIASLTLTAPERAKPGTPITLRIEAPKHPRARVLVTGLDEGVWIKQAHKPQRPEEVFYQKWAHTLRVSEHLPFVASWGKEVIGGDVGYDASDLASLIGAEAYEQTLSFERELQLDGQGRAEVSFIAPAFSGKVRWRAYLVEERVYGSAEAFTIVAAPVIGRMGVPFYIAGGEEIETNLVLRNTTGQPQNGRWRIAFSPNAVEVVPKEGSFSLSPGGVQTVNIRYKANRPWGLTTVSLYVNEELAQERQIRIRPAAAPRTLKEAFRLPPGTDTVLNLPSDFFYNPRGETNVLISASPIDEIGPVLLDLLRFPHGCAEQITSQAFVSLKLRSVAAAFYPGGADSVDKHVRYVLGQLPLYRAGDGYAFWPGGSAVPWLTLYVTHFLIEASESGYEEAKRLLSLLETYVEWIAQNTHPRQYEAAYAAFLLARWRGAQAKALLPSVKVVEEGQDPMVRAFWRAAFKLSGMPTLPARLPLSEKMERELSYASPVMRYLYAESFVDTTGLRGIFDEQVGAFLREPYLSTHQAAWVLLTYERRHLTGRGNLSGQVTLGQQTLTLEGSVWSRSVREQEGKTLRLRAGRDTLYVLLWGESYPITSPPAVSEGLTITDEIIPRGGQQYVWRIRIRSKLRARLENVALTVPYPSGFMLDRATLSQESRYPPAQGLSWDYTDLREDRFLGYFTLEKEEAQIELPLRLIYPGRYQIPSISAMVMYAPTIQGTTAARWWKAPAF
jgi:uncharacterized protein YfaS (alpha-2-macroglobulin family)